MSLLVIKRTPQVRRVVWVWGVALALWVWSTALAWGHSLRPPPQYAPPPPPMQSPSPALRGTGHQRPYCQRKRCGTARFDAEIKLGGTEIWLRPSTDSTGLSHMLVDLSLLKMSTENTFDSRRRLIFGGGLGAIDMRFERWLQPIQGLANGEYAIQALEAAPMFWRIGARHWYVDATTMAYRRVNWQLPESEREALWKRAGLKGFAPDSFESTAPMYLTPGMRVGLRVGVLDLNAGLQLLDWHMGSYRGHVTGTITTSVVRVTLETTYQRDQLRMRMKADEDHPDAGEAIGALWQRATWDTQLMVEVDFVRLFHRASRYQIARVHGLVGVRYRHNFAHRLEDRTGAVLFREPTGSQWSVLVGLQVAFGYDGLSQYR